MSDGGPIPPRLQPLLPRGLCDSRESPLHPKHGILHVGGLWSLENNETHFIHKMDPLTRNMIIFLILMFSMKTLHRNRDWKNNYTLYESGIKTTPNNIRMLTFHATANLVPNREFVLAEKLYRHLLEVEPSYVSGYRNLGELLKRVGKYNESIEV